MNQTNDHNTTSRLSDLVGSEVVAGSGESVGRLRDMTVMFADTEPNVRRIVVSEGRNGARRYISWTDVVRFEPQLIEIRPRSPMDDEHDSPPGEVALVRDVLDVQVLDTTGRRFGRVGDVRLAREGHELRVAGVEIGTASILHRLGLSHFVRADDHLIGWADIHLMSGRGHALQLEIPGRGADRLPPAAVAKLVGGLPTHRGAEVVTSLPPDLAAATLSRIRPQTTGRLLGLLPTRTSAALVSRMPQDDAAAALRHLRRDTLETVLEGMASNRADQLRRLITHPPHTAAGLMNPDVIVVGSDATPDEIRQRIRDFGPTLDALVTVFVVDAQTELRAIPARHLLTDRFDTVPTPSVRWDASIESVIGEFAIHDILALPVLDDAGDVIGAVAVDDVLEELLAERLPGGHRIRMRRGRRR